MRVRVSPVIPAAGSDVPVPTTVLVGSGWGAAEPSVRALARRLATRLRHEVAVHDLGGSRDALAAAGGRSRGGAPLVVLPVALEPAGAPDPRRAAAIRDALSGCPAVRVHLGRAPAVDDVARMLGDRARAAAAALTAGGRRPAEVIVVIAAGDGANPVRNAEVARLARLVYEAERFADIACAFAGPATPTIGDVVARWTRLGARGIVVVAYSLFERDQYRTIAREAHAAAIATGVEVAVARPLDTHPALVWALVRRHLEALADMAPALPGSGTPAPWVNPELLRVVEHQHGRGSAGDGGWEQRLAALLPPRYRDPGVSVSSAPMGAAPLQRDREGRVAWDLTWQAFCELALAGGPPHRGALLEPVAPEEVRADPERYAEVRDELARGLEMVTGLRAVLDASDGWIGLECAGEEMAIWLMRAIVVENVMVRREGAILYLPAGPRFTIEGEIRNVVTAVAKTHHYWIEHQAARRSGAAASRGEEP